MHERWSCMVNCEVHDPDLCCRRRPLIGVALGSLEDGGHTLVAILLRSAPARPADVSHD